MKKNILFTLILISIPIMAYASGKITAIDGKIQVQRAGTTAWVDAASGMAVNTKDKIKSMFASSAVIELSDGSNITIAENTVITFSDIKQKKKINIKLNFGGLNASVLKRDLMEKSVFKVVTPVAVAGVRGTEFEVSEGMDGSGFLVYDGVVEVMAKGKKIILKKQETVKVNKQGRISKKKRIRKGKTLIKVTKKIKKIIKKVREKRLRRREKNRKPKKKTGTDTSVRSGTSPLTITKKPVLPPGPPVLTEPVDNQVLTVNKINISGSAEDKTFVFLKINNADISKVRVKNGTFEFKDVLLSEGKNRISVYSAKIPGQADKFKELRSSEVSVYVTVMTSVPPPEITSPGAGSNFNRGAEPVITLAVSDFLEWTKKNPIDIAGRISYNYQLSLPELKGKWVSDRNQGIEGDISVIITAANESYEYSARSDASGNFSVSGVTINLPEGQFVTKINNEDVPVPGGSLQYSWVLAQGDNKLTIDAQEKDINITVKISGRTSEGIESKESVVSYISKGKTASLTKGQKHDSLQPIAEVEPVVEDFVVRVTTRDPEPTSGVYKVESEGISFKRVEGTEKSYEQIWEGNIRIIKPKLPPYPPKQGGGVLTRDLVIKVTDRAENETKINATVQVVYNE